MRAPQILKTLILTGLLTVLLLSGLWIWQGRIVVEKIATVLAMPCGILWYLLLCVTVIACRYAHRKVAALTGLVFLIYSVSGNGFVAGAVTRTLEAPYYQVHPLQQDPFDLVIVLGGGASPGGNGRIQGNASGDRLIVAAQLYHAGLAPKLLCTGTRIAEMGVKSDPGKRSARVLTRLGVPESAILFVGGRTTSEEMAAIRKQFDTETMRIGLVTSAWHLPRTMRLAERNNLKVHPLPADFMSGPSGTTTVGQKIAGCIPQADSFATVARISKEYLGMAVGR